MLEEEKRWAQWEMYIMPIFFLLLNFTRVSRVEKRGRQGQAMKVENDKLGYLRTVESDTYPVKKLDWQ